MNTVIEKILTNVSAREVSEVESQSYDEGDNKFAPWGP